MKRTLLVAALVGLVSSIGCTAKDDNAGSGDGNADDDGSGGDDDGDGDGGSAADGGTFMPMPTTSGADDGMATGGSTMAADDGPSPEDDTIGFIEQPDGGGIANECDQWTQDCPKGEKCMPWANDGGGAWNATRCSPISANPGQVGDECMVEGSGTSGVDNCDIGSMCYYVDPKTSLGVCVGFCLGTADAPQCDPGYLCSISNNGVLTLCRIQCDPLLQDCQTTGDNTACLPAAGADGFVCIVDASGDMGMVGDPCEFLNSCDPGFWCAAAEAVPGCAGASGCCTEFCDLTEPDPDAACSLAGMGASCEPWWEEGQAPPSLEHVGACVLPA